MRLARSYGKLPRRLGRHFNKPDKSFNMDKDIEYKKLIAKRQTFKFPQGLANYGDIGLEIDHVDGLAAWHSDLDANIMLVCQDFADTKTLIKDNGKIEPEEGKFRYRTNKNLTYLFKDGLGIDLGHPCTPNKNAKLFFTNAIIGLKTEGGMQGKIKSEWASSSATNFLKPLIEIIKPKVIIALGQSPFQAIHSIYKGQITPDLPSNLPFKDYVGKFFVTKDKTKIFPVYHCGVRAVNSFRKIEEQLVDWQNIKKHMASN